MQSWMKSCILSVSEILQWISVEMGLQYNLIEWLFILYLFYLLVTIGQDIDFLIKDCSNHIYLYVLPKLVFAYDVKMIERKYLINRGIIKNINKVLQDWNNQFFTSGADLFEQFNNLTPDQQKVFKEIFKKDNKGSSKGRTDEEKNQLFIQYKEEISSIEQEQSELRAKLNKLAKNRKSLLSKLERVKPKNSNNTDIEEHVPVKKTKKGNKTNKTD